LENGLRSCWSVPIVSSRGAAQLLDSDTVLGTFALYQKQPATPSADAETLLSTAVHLARLAIDRDRSFQVIRESEAGLAAISELTRCVTFAMRFHSDGTWRIEWAHPHFGLLSGYSEDDCNCLGSEIMFHPDDRDRVRQFFLRIASGEIMREEFRYVTKAGENLNVLLHGKLLESGPTAAEGLIIGGLLDITELKSVENELRLSEERFQLAMRGANDGLWDWNLKTNQMFLSPRWKSMLGYTEGQIVDTFETWMRLMHPEDKPLLKTKLREFLSGPADNFEGEFRMCHQSEGYRTILCRGFLMRSTDRRPVRMVGTHQDITERKQADEELRGSRQRLQALSRQLIAGRETELRHLARELHDEIGQVLTAMKMNVRSIQRTADEQVRMRLDENVEMIDRAVDQVRFLSLNMRPPHLDDLGLVATLHWYLNQQAKIGGFQTRLVVDPPELQVPNELGIVCFRIAQEAVTNAIRHTVPRMIEIELRQTGDELHLMVRDDGNGFDLQEALKRAMDGASLGLIGMQERASLAEGRVEISSNIGQGTTIHASFLSSRS